jgi:large subunit ribosomal protein L21
MYAIVEIAGQQFKIENDSKIFVHRLEGEEGTKLEFDKVLLIENEGKVKVGKPVVKNAKVTATILSHKKGDKVLVFKKKRRKGYQKLNGHRQQFTELQIENIVA